MLFINASEQFKSMLSQPALRIDEIRASETGSAKPPTGANYFSLVALSNNAKSSRAFGSLKIGRKFGGTLQ